MRDLDDRIRGALSGLRETPIPDVPRLRPVAPEPRGIPLGVVAAVAMLALLAFSLPFASFRSRTPEARVASRIEMLEARIEKIEHEELRALLSRELALLRRELELAQPK